MFKINIIESKIMGFKALRKKGVKAPKSVTYVDNGIIR
jgi:hypothetical protein